MILGITGPTGSGKTTLLGMIEQAGGLILDCDAIYHDLLTTDQDLLSAIENRFAGVVKDGQLDRKALGAVVFANAQALQDLNRITHTAVKNQVLRRLETKPSLAAIDAIGLFEGNLHSLCNVTVAVVAPAEMRVARLMARDGITEEYARKRISAQHPQSWYCERCDYTLTNDSTADTFACKCLAFLAELGIMKEKM